MSQEGLSPNLREKVAEAIDNGSVQWQIHTLYNQFGLETDDIREAVYINSRGVLSMKVILGESNDSSR
jgi:hypothetical protein